MAWKRCSYNEVNSLMKPGDIIAFSGDSIVEEVVKLITNSKVSHMAIIFHQGQLIEAISNGVRIDNLSRSIEAFNGAVWWLPLSTQARANMSIKHFYQYLLMQEHEPFEVPHSIISAIGTEDNSNVLKLLAKNSDDFARIFCSELIAGALEAGGIIPHLKASEVTPADLCRFSIFEEDYYQIKGQTTVINGFNTLSPVGFGE